MQIKAYQLATAVRKNLSDIYLLSGDDLYMRQEACDLVCQQAITQGFAPGKTFYKDAEFDEQVFFSQLYHASFFDEQQIIKLDLSKATFNKACVQLLTTCIAQPLSHKLLLIIMPKLDAKTKKASWFKDLTTKISWVETWPLKRSDFKPWLKQKAANLNLRIAVAGLEFLAARMEGNIGLAVQTLADLKHHFGEQLVTPDMLSAGLTDHSCYQVFDLVDSAVAAQPKRCLKILDYFQGNNAPVISLLGALHYEIKRLAICSREYTPNKFVQLCRQQGVWPQKQPAFKAALERLQANDFTKLHCLLALVDQAIKGWLTIDPWHIMRELVLYLAGRPTTTVMLLLNK